MNSWIKVNPYSFHTRSKNMNRLKTKPTKWHVRPAKTHISLGIRPVWSHSSLCAQRVAKHPRSLHADSKDSDQTGRNVSLIWVSAGRTCHFVGFVMRRLIYLVVLSFTLLCYFAWKLNYQFFFWVWLIISSSALISCLLSSGIIHYLVCNSMHAFMWISNS